MKTLLDLITEWRKKADYLEKRKYDNGATHAQRKMTDEVVATIRLLADQAEQFLETTPTITIGDGRTYELGKDLLQKGQCLICGSKKTVILPGLKYCTNCKATF